MVKNGHEVTVISSNPAKQKDIEDLRANAAIGSIDDVAFLTKTFKEADAVYCMVPPNFAEQDQVAYYMRIANNYAEAIKQTRIKNALLLSSYGAHLEKGTGFIVGSHHAEKIFNGLQNVAITHIRPGYFYYNLLNFANMIKKAGFIGANYGGNDALVFVAPNDIATAVADEITKPSTGIKVRYVASDERTCNEVAKVLGNVIGKPGLEWKTLPAKRCREVWKQTEFPNLLQQFLLT